MDTSIDIKKYYQNFKDFLSTFVVPFYLDFSKQRLLTQKGTHEFESAQKMTYHLLNTLMIQAAPISIYTCQDLFSHMPVELFEGGIKPKTVFQLAWPLDTMMRQVKPAFWGNFEMREKFDLLLNVR